jgi:hypothetical protein
MLLGFIFALVKDYTSHSEFPPNFIEVFTEIKFIKTLKVYFFKTLYLNDLILTYC